MVSSWVVVRVGEQEPDAGGQLGGGRPGTPGNWPRRRRRADRRRGRGCSSARTPGARGSSGQTSRTLSHRVTTRSKRSPAKTLRCFDSAPARSMPCSSRIDPHRVGVQGLGVAAGAAGLDPAAGADTDQRLGHLGPGAVARAQEQHPGRHRCRRCWAAGRGGARGARPRRWPRAGRRSGAGRRCSRRRGRRPSCAARTPSRRPAACRGGTRPGSGAPPPARSAPARSGRCGPGR